MKTNLTISEITHDDLVNLFSTSLYGSNYLDADYDQHSDLEDCECYEDKLAKSVLNGRTIRFVDRYAEGSIYGNLPSQVDDEEDEVTYWVSFEDIKRGLENAANGTFYTRPDVSEDFARGNSEFARRSFNAFADEDCCNFDYCTADCLMQIILFNEIIYG